MGKNAANRRSFRGVVSVLLLFVLFTQLFVPNGIPSPLISREPFTSLQVPSFFDPDNYLNRLKFELRTIRQALVEEGKNLSHMSINAMLDECYDGYGRLLNIKGPPVKKDSGSVTVDLELMPGTVPEEILHEKLRDLIKPIVEEYDPENNTIRVTYPFHTDGIAATGRDLSDDPLRGEERYVDSFDGAKIAYDLTGSGEELIVLVHYWGGKKEQWKRFLDVILKRNFFKKYTVLSLDLRGFGNSELRGKSWRDNTEEIRRRFGTDRFLRSLYVKYCAHDIKIILEKENFIQQKAFSGINLMGHSLGGMVSMQFALEFPEITKSLALIHTSADPIHTFSPITVLPGSTWVVKQGLRAVANISERALFLYEDLLSLQKGGLEKLTQVLDAIKSSEDHRLTRYFIKNIPGGEVLFRHYISGLISWYKDVAIKHDKLLMEKIPRKFGDTGNGIKERFFDLVRDTTAFSWFLESILLDGEDREVVEEIVRVFEEVSFYALVHTFFALSFIDFPKNVLGDRIKCPVLVVRGMKDLVTGRKSAWARPIKGLRRLAILLGKHMGPQEYPRDLADIIGWFLRTSESGAIEEDHSMDSETEEKILSGERVNINEQRAEKIVLMKEDGIYAIDELGKGMGDVKQSLIKLMEQVDTKVSRELRQVFSQRSIMDYIPGGKGNLGTGDSYLYIRNGRLAGFLNFMIERFKNRYTVRGRLAVLPEEQEKGTGFALLDHAIGVSMKKYTDFTGFTLMLSPGENIFFDKYFRRRYKNRLTGPSWYIDTVERTVEEHHDAVGFRVELMEYTDEDSKDRAVRTINRTGRSAGLLMNLLGVKGAFSPGRSIPVDIIIDLSLIPGNDRKANMATWAHLILSCRRLDNVNFVFRAPHNLDIFNRSIDPEALKFSDIPSMTSAMRDLQRIIREEAYKYGLAEGRVENILNKCIYEGRRDKAIAVPIVSSRILDLAQRRGIKLKTGVFPVAMDGRSGLSGGLGVLRNYQAALTLSLAKAALVMARDEGREDLRSLIKDVLPRLNRLYGVFSNIELHEADLIYMIDPSPVHRLRMAIDMSIPDIVKMPLDLLPSLHEAVQTCLCYA
jgi:pimeloyl-ACP methyl ester carboxylesterase/GNAT superfamily N-acetyltransferase